METRAYFLFGDIISNLSVGALTALTCGFLFSSWPMWIGMIVAMVLGMIIATAATVTIFLPRFGAMEVMLPVMTTGMFAGMAVVMWPTQSGLLGDVQIGLSVGCAVFVLTWIINSIVVGKRSI